MKTMVCFVLGKRNKKIEEKVLSFGFDVVFIKEVSKIEEITKQETKDYNAILIKTENVEMLRRIIDKAANYFDIFVLGTNDKINRAALEHKKVKALVSPEYNRKFDYTSYRNSGMNHVLCKIARNNDKTIIENFSEFLAREKKDRATWLGRILQNARLCKKYKAKFIVTQFVKGDEIDNMVDSRKLNDFFRILS